MMDDNRKIEAIKKVKEKSGYETHAVSSFLNWLEDEYVSNFPTNKKPHEYGALCNRLTSKCFISNP